MKVRRLRFDFLKQLNAFLFGACFLISSVVCSQEISIVDATNKVLEGVFIYNATNEFNASSDSLGKIYITDNTEYPLFVTFLGYKNKKVTRQELIDSNFVIKLIQDDVLMEEIVMIGRTNIKREDLAYETSIITAKDIQLNASQTSADALQSNSGVYIQKSQMGGGSPIVRGFEANKLLLVVDGVRLNNTIYRSGHLQNAITIDASILGSLEVIYGPGSLTYGSDALGGVVHFRSKEILLAEAEKEPLEIGYFMRYGSSNNERTMHADISHKSKRWGSLTSVTISDFDDLRIGANRAAKYSNNYALRAWYVRPGDEANVDEEIVNENPLKLLSTGYSQYDFLQKFKFQLSDKIRIIWNNQFSTSSNIPRYDALTERRNQTPRFSQWNYGPQQRFLSSVTTKYVVEESVFFDKVNWIVAYQNVNEVRITSFFGSDLIEEQNERLNILNTTLDFSKVNENHQFYYGIDGNFNDLNSTAFQETYASGDRVEGGLTRYPNDLGRSYSSGAYAQYYYLSDSWYKINLGARYDYNQVDIRFARDNVFEWPDYFYEGISNRNHSLNGSIGFHVKLPAGFNMRTLLGTSFRAPNIDDIAKTRLNNDEISVPNDQLLPEKSISGELTLSYQKQGSQFSITGFYTQLQDAIIRENFTLPSGETIYVTNNDTFNIVANVNAENAFIQGVSVNIDQQIAKGLNVEASYNVLMGRVVNKGDVDDPLGHIPPNYGRFFMTYEKDRLQLQAGTRFNGFKPLDNYGGSVDNPEFATENGSESWYTLHATAAFEIHKSFTLQVGMDNILDQFYVPFASGVPGAGRHISITMRGQF